MPTQSTVNKRISLLKSGFKKYVNIRRLPMDTETKWTIEVVSVDENFPIPEGFLKDPNLSMQRKGKLYSLQVVTSFCRQINANRAEWIKVMKG